jgi:hypothetical protein
VVALIFSRCPDLSAQTPYQGSIRASWTLRSALNSLLPNFLPSYLLRRVFSMIVFPLIKPWLSDSDQVSRLLFGDNRPYTLSRWLEKAATMDRRFILWCPRHRILFRKPEGHEGRHYWGSQCPQNCLRLYLLTPKAQQSNCEQFWLAVPRWFAANLSYIIRSVPNSGAVEIQLNAEGDCVLWDTIHSPARRKIDPLA